MLCDSEVCNRAWLEQIGKGPSARFSTVEKMKMTPEEWARRNNPGPGQYNLTEEAKIEAMALQVRGKPNLTRELQPVLNQPQAQRHRRLHLSTREFLRDVERNAAHASGMIEWSALPQA